MLKEFKNFIMTGNVVEFAVAVIMAGAIGAVVTGFVGDIIMPIVGHFSGGMDFSSIAITLDEATKKADGTEVPASGWICDVPHRKIVQQIEKTSCCPSTFWSISRRITNSNQRFIKKIINLLPYNLLETASFWRRFFFEANGLRIVANVFPAFRTARRIASIGARQVMSFVKIKFQKKPLHKVDFL
jgi:large-conductance mechanosensitive channel